MLYCGMDQRNIWYGEKVRLRAWEPDDWRHDHRWLQDTDASRSTWFIPMPQSETTVRSHAQEASENQGRGPDDNFSFIIESLAGESLRGDAVGTINAHDCDRLSGNLSYGIFVNSDQRRRDYASEAILLLLRFYFAERRYQKANAGVYSFNDASIRLHEKLGFTLEGRQRRYAFTDGAYHDVLRYGLTVEEFHAKHGDWLHRLAQRPS